MTVADKEMYFNYDAAGVPVSIVYNGTSYYYVTNLQGDVVGIVNQSGNQLVAYTYDAWGNILTTTGSSAGSLGKYNPLRYRGYVYDVETKLYYLQSRYYNPEWGRFINADGLVSTGQGLLGNNMFAYCLNSPIIYRDDQGTHAEMTNTDEDPRNDLWPDPMGGAGETTQTSGGIGFKTFSALKSFLGSPGNGWHWHHNVEQCQIEKSGFAAELIHNTSNVFAVDAGTHAKITGYYNSTKFEFTNGLSVRNWLAGQSFQTQSEFGMNVLRIFGVIE